MRAVNFFIWVLCVGATLLILYIALSVVFKTRAIRRLPFLLDAVERGDVDAERKLLINSWYKQYAERIGLGQRYEAMYRLADAAPRRRQREAVLAKNIARLQELERNLREWRDEKEEFLKRLQSFQWYWSAIKDFRAEAGRTPEYAQVIRQAIFGEQTIHEGIDDNKLTEQILKLVAQECQEYVD